MLDVVIVGGGPAGLSAALILGRCRRRVLVADAGAPRNVVSRVLHGFLTRDGTPPLDLLRLGREELARYDIDFRHSRVCDVRLVTGHFEVVFDNGERTSCRKLLLATGVLDRLPDLEGAQACYGRSLFHCPYCDAWEVRDRKLAAYGRRRAAVGLSLSLKTWSSDVLLCTDSTGRLSRTDRDILARHGVAVRQERVARLEHDDGLLRRIVFTSGESVEREAMFFNTGQYLRSDLPARLGCDFTRKGVVKTGNLGDTCVPGLFVAGDASRDVQFAVVAAAEGAKVGYAINVQLQKEGLD